MEAGLQGRTAWWLLAALLWPLPMTWLPPDPSSSPTPVLSAGPATTNFTVHADTGEQLQRLAEALLAFSGSGLDLPPLEITFYEGTGGCDGEKGLFRGGSTPWHIAICELHVTSIVEHELAHAWERANVDDHQRDDFLDLMGLEAWHNPADPWNERGVEWAAVVIQQSVAGLPLPPVLSKRSISRLEGFEVLTGQVAPVLVDWVEARGVPCPQRPTPLSQSISDSLGTVCP